MKIKHEHIRMAMNVWAHPDGEKVPAAKITKAYFELGMTFPADTRDMPIAFATCCWVNPTSFRRFRIRSLIVFFM